MMEQHCTCVPGRYIYMMPTCPAAYWHISCGPSYWLFGRLDGKHTPEPEKYRGVLPPDVTTMCLRRRVFVCAKRMPSAWISFLVLLFLKFLLSKYLIFLLLLFQLTSKILQTEKKKNVLTGIDLEGEWERSSFNFGFNVGCIKLSPTPVNF